MKLILIRHGATKSNDARKYAGRTDEALSETGKQMIDSKKQEGTYPPVDCVAASPMLRCLQTAEHIYDCAPSFLSEKWREMDFGAFEGKTYEQLKDRTNYQTWLQSNGVLPFPDGEGKRAFVKRCSAGFQEFVDYLRIREPVPESAALIVHGGTIMAILSTYFKKEYYSFQCGNAEGYLCELELKNPPVIHAVEPL